jgi:hypothetical protein
MSDVIEKAEKLGRRRARLLVVNGVLLLGLQVAYFVQAHAIGADPTVTTLTLGAWALLVVTMLVALLTSGGYGYGPEVRALVNDESAQANRDAAFRLGFTTTILSALGIYLLSHHAHHHLSAQLASHIIITFGLAATMIRYGLLERKEHKLG